MRIAFSFFLILFITGAFKQDNTYQFPVRPGQQNYLAGTMGELRGAHFHGGIDIKTGGVTGRKVYAAADGYVSRIKIEGYGYGNALYIAHPSLGTTTVYGHLKKFVPQLAEYTRKAQYRQQRFSIDLYPDKQKFPVKKGDLIAYSGNSGGSSGPHLHFEIRDQYQRPLNPLDYGFDEIQDHRRPTVQKIALKTMDSHSRINHQFGFFEFTPSHLGNVYSISKPIEIHGKTGILLMGYDRLDGVPNRNGIPHIKVKVDDRQVMAIDIDAIPFSKTRQVLCFEDYAVKSAENKTFQKLYIDDGNDLSIYKTDEQKGIISIEDTLPHKVEITLSDAHANITTIHFELKGCTPSVTAIEKDRSFQPFRNKIVDNTLVFMGKKADKNGYFAHVFANHKKYELTTSYYVNDYAVYLWDLHKGPPDSIKLCEKMIYPGIEMTVPSEAEFTYFKNEFDLHFSAKTLFDTLYLKTDYMDELSDNKEYFEISEDVYPLKKSLDVVLKPKRRYPLKEKTSAYYTTDLKNFSFVGGKWHQDVFKFTTRVLGKFTLLPDTIAPKIKVVEQNHSRFRAFITDDLSGIGSFELTVNGQWVLLNYDPKRNYIWSEKENPHQIFNGSLKLKVRDNVNNENIYQTNIK